ncbi:MAG: hypothetical protein FWF92_10860 [Oscillospiraceae bacterium]|nr:hypothetical protein [Oscillospiraceae bacterium]
MKKNHKIKFAVMLLIISVILLPLIISCGENKSDEIKTPDDGVANNDVKLADENENPDDISEPQAEELYDYPEYDFKGESVNILARKDNWAGGSQDYDDLYVESETGEVLNDAVYKRNQTVEEKYNVQIKVEPVADANSTIQKSIKAGDDDYQIIQEKLVFMSATLAPQNYLFDLKSVASLNLDAPWYNQNAIKDLSINNKITTLGGDITISDKSGVIMTVFSKKLSLQYGLENLYNTVNDGKWTLDKMYELMMQTTADLNGDGKMTVKEDQWGLVCEDYAGWMFAIGSGNRLAELDENGIPYITCTNEKNVSDYEKIKKVLYEKEARATVSDPEDHVNIFIDNRCFLSVDALSSITMLRGMEDDFGIIPLPKQDENQKDYISSISPWISRFIAIPSTCGNPEMVGAVIDAMSRESVNTVVPAYYNNLLNQKIARDDESIEMLKQIFSSVIYDIGSVFSWGSIWDEQMMFISAKKEDYIGNYERIEGKVQKALEKTIETMQQFD